MIRRIALAAIALSLALSATAADLTDAQRADIESRIKPVGEVCMQGDASCGGAAVVASTGPRSGEDVYNAACMACHSTGAGGAPIVGDVAAWADRIGKGMDVLYVSGVQGVPGTGMIAKGGCMACSDEEIHASVDFMVAGSQ
ncbi:MAG: c-type cytochrome [Halioglobus sp.]